MNNNFIEIKNVSFAYQNQGSKGQKQVLKNINLNIKQGEFVALLGHNASGKSTLAYLLNGMRKPTSSKILVDSIDTSDEEKSIDIRKKVGLILQNPDNQIVAGIVEEDVAFGPENLRLPPEEIKKRVNNALKAVDMLEFKDKAPHELSGGQKQRVAIAGVIAMQPKCIILDEPTSMLDPKGREEVLETIKYLNKEKNITIILITHHMEEAAIAKRIVVLEKGQIAMDAPPREVFKDIKKLSKLNLDAPQATKLAIKLKQRGINLDKVIINEYECINELLKLFKRDKIN